MGLRGSFTGQRLSVRVQVEVVRSPTPTALVVGGGHNGLVAACYLARAGIDVTVLEQSDKVGGGSRTDETISG